MCWHRWSKWQTYTLRLIKSDLRFPNTHITVTETRQMRRCEKCLREEHVEVANADGAAWDNGACIVPITKQSGKACAKTPMTAPTDAKGETTT